MKRALVLLTTAFPFAPGEPYLETELPVLAERFDHIFLFTIGLTPGMAPVLPTPENVTVCNCATQDAKSAKVRDVLAGLPTVFSQPDVPREDMREAGRDPARRAFLGYFLSRTDRFTREIADCIPCMGLSAYDAVTIYSYWLFLTASTAIRLKSVLLGEGVKHVRVISRAHGYDVYASRNALSYLPCRAMILQGLDAVYPCSQNGHTLLCQGYPQFRDKIHTAYLGASASEYRCGSSDGVIRILTCGRAIALKRLERVDAALRLLPDTQRAEWTHIGDGPALHALYRRSETLPGHVQVRFPGAMSHEDVLLFYRTHAVDVFVSASRSEGLPVSAMEALSFGVPVIATRVGGSAELIDGGKNGVVIPADFSDRMLLQAIQSVSSGGENMRRAALQVWQTKFDARRNYAAFADLLCLQ